jgi:hypothetical protein
VKVFYDTEFIEDGRTIDLISIGMVAEDGRELYLIAEEIEADPLYSRICKHDWLMANVVPHLPLKAATDYWKPIEQPSAARVDGGGRFALDPHDNRIMPRRMLRNSACPRAFRCGRTTSSSTPPAATCCRRPARHTTRWRTPAGSATRTGRCPRDRGHRRVVAAARGTPLRRRPSRLDVDHTGPGRLQAQALPRPVPGLTAPFTEER